MLDKKSMGLLKNINVIKDMINAIGVLSDPVNNIKNNKPTIRKDETMKPQLLKNEITKISKRARNEAICGDVKKGKKNRP